MDSFDLVVIGGGPAGEKGAAQAAYFGKKVAIIEKEPYFGGACVNTGTLPSKTLRESAIFFSGLKAREIYHVDWKIKDGVTVQDLMHRKDEIQRVQREQIDRNIARHKIERVAGAAVFEDAHTLRVSEINGGQDASPYSQPSIPARMAGSPRERGGRAIRGDVILIATGSRPHRPDNIAFDDTHIYDSDTILQLDAIPKSLTVIGGGVIGCEYACLFAALGAHVTLVDGRDRLLPFLDGDVANGLSESMKQRLHIDIVFNAKVKSVGRDPARGVVTTLEDGRSIASDKLLFAAGRSGVTHELGLDKLGIRADSRGQLAVNEHFQTTVPHIYAAGDVIGFPALASTSMEQGRVAMCHAFDLKYKDRVSPVLPYGIYTIPEVSCAGLSEEEAGKKGRAPVTGRVAFSNNPRGQIAGTDGFLKLIFDRDSRKLLGVHILGENAAEVVHVGVSCLMFQGTVDFFIASVFNYPTLCDAYKYAAYDALGRWNA
ncbi:MAG: FAD-dependent oxidoreductase [Nitrospirae bacterium]|nr:FAD-dependent oxidoreductase [Nitrospirota bacterium]